MLPLKPLIFPAIAKQLIEQNLQLFMVIPLTAVDYNEVIQRMVTKNIIGGGIYDALIAQIVLKEEISYLLTLNANHFTRLGEEIAAKVKIP
ncbi:hypothetical protein C7H19_20820 [Aphanothece hegewaldii CCALA 016]|uniref:PIN domain-containing protein n=1 Tax=Aphanothece hegewaldii CCALA 016 TaxID=2107694 RepID=A0A2T1LSL3_9CHRO|nr:hypothetical protein [Aphanothece hegewaldii]PSF33044.1 hypothetical protein C7H19_20820 [Aphanothece hegewaldii CCALA 016]